METPVDNSKPHGEALEELIGAQALSADLKTALLACLTGAESRRWTVGELWVVLIISGFTAQSQPCWAPWQSLNSEISLCHFLPWSLVEQGTEWSLAPKSELIELLSGVRKLPGISSDPHRRAQGGATGRDRLSAQGRSFTDPDSGDSRAGGSSLSRGSSKKEFLYTAPGKDFNWWRPTPEALLALGLRSYSEIPELKALEHYFDSQKSFQTELKRKPTCSRF